LSAAVAGIVFVPAAGACGLPANLQAPFTIRQLRLDAQNPLESVPSASLARDLGNASNARGASIVGMWSIQFISEGNETHNPPIPDGAMIDFGYTQWHSDGTEFLNSGGRAPATQNFCLGVWAQTGYSTWQLNHFAITYDASGAYIGKANIQETVTLSPGGTKYSGTFSITVFNVTGTQIDHLAGQVTADRITVDTTIP
jgi:hypothetical protein